MQIINSRPILRFWPIISNIPEKKFYSLMQTSLQLVCKLPFLSLKKGKHFLWYIFYFSFDSSNVASPLRVVLEIPSPPLLISIFGLSSEKMVRS